MLSRQKTELSPPSLRRTLLVFQVADQKYAVSSADVAEIVPMAELRSLPGAPTLLAGFLNLGGCLVPVIRLHHLFGLPVAIPELWTPLVILRDSGRRLAVLVDSVTHTLAIEIDAILPLPLQHAVNQCVIGVVRSGNDAISILSPQRLLLEQENNAIAQLQQMARQRIDELEGVTA